jgi:plastocyanin
MSFRRLAGIASVTVAVLVAGCGGSPPAGGEGTGRSSTEPPPTEPPQPLPGASTVSGKVSLSGTAPEGRLIRVSNSDPLCMVEGGALRSERVVVGSGNTLQNVFLYVKDGLPSDMTFQAPRTPVVLDQVGCRYRPHVFGVQVGQPVQIVNSDATLHNVHAVPKVNSEFNFSQAVKGQKDVRVFDKPEVMVPFQCDVHGWMASYAGVVAHPFFAVSGSDGTFTIKGLPAGTYTIEAWHEQLGRQAQTVKVDGTSAATTDFTFMYEE